MKLRYCTLLALASLSMACVSEPIAKRPKAFSVAITQPVQIAASVSVDATDDFTLDGLAAATGVREMRLTITNTGTAPVYVSWKNSFYTVRDRTIPVYSQTFSEGNRQVDKDRTERDAEIAPGETLNKTVYATSQLNYCNDTIGWRIIPLPGKEISLSLSLRSADIQEACVVQLQRLTEN